MLASLGFIAVLLTTGWVLIDAGGVSADRWIIVGTGNHNGLDEAWLAKLPCFALPGDGNGNVGQLLSLDDGSVVTAYEYDAYGNITAETDGEYAPENPFRFSTKFHDDDTGWVYYGYRFYGPEWGRWGSRDPISEEGGLNVFRSMNNSSTDAIDPQGEMSVSVSQRTCTITITLKIAIYGSLATQPLANKIKTCIESAWNGFSTNVRCPAGTSCRCKVVVVANVAVWPIGGWIPPVGLGRGLDWVEIIDVDYAWGGHWGANQPCWVFAHEAGHLMGHGDDYTVVSWGTTTQPRKSRAHEGHEGHMMADTRGTVAQHEIDFILEFNPCPGKCCGCGTTSAPTSTQGSEIK